MNAIAHGAGEQAMPGTTRAAPIKVLFVINSAGVGGAEMQTISLLNGLDPQRFQLSLAYLKDERDLLDKIVGARLGGTLLCCHVSSRLDLAAARRLAVCIDREAIDIVVCSNAYPLIYGWLGRCLARRGARIVAVFHSTELRTRKERLRMWLCRPLFLLSEALVYVCENQRRYWRGKLLLSRREAVIHNGIDIDHFADGRSPLEVALLRGAYGFTDADYVVGLCACMRPEKAHGDLLEAVAAVLAGGVRIKCLLVGDGPERRAIEAKIVRMGLSASVVITGFLSDVRPAIAACDVVVSASHHHETFSIAALEAMALGKPMIMTDIGGASEQVVDAENGYLYQRGDIAALTRCLLQLADQTRCRQMGSRARQTVIGKFSLAAMVGGYDSLFVGLMPASRQPGHAGAQGNALDADGGHAR